MGWLPFVRKRREVRLLVLQPTPFCNLACDYCYLPDRDDRSRMSLGTLRRVFERLAESRLFGPEISVVWHAGEPLVVPLSFYRDACALIDEITEDRVDVRHCVQTNGTLIDAAWCRLLLERHFYVGVSIDGPAFLHDQHRRGRSGGSTHARVMRGIRALQDWGVPFHVICVLTRESLVFADEIFDFFMSAGITNVGFNVEELEGVHRATSLEGQDAEEAMRRFLARFLDRVVMSGHAMAVREFDALLGSLGSIACSAEDGNDQTTPGRILSVDHAGSFSTFSPELLGFRSERHGDFRFGNVWTDSFASIAGNPAYRVVMKDVEEGVRRCRRDCEYFRVCGGGAPANKLFETGSFTASETLFCRLTRKAVADTVLNWSEREGALEDDGWKTWRRRVARG